MVLMALQPPPPHPPLLVSRKSHYFVDVEHLVRTSLEDVFEDCLNFLEKPLSNSRLNMSLRSNRTFSFVPLNRGARGPPPWHRSDC
jgi:hypothetical protein